MAKILHLSVPTMICVLPHRLLIRNWIERVGFDTYWWHWFWPALLGSHRFVSEAQLRSTFTELNRTSQGCMSIHAAVQIYSVQVVLVSATRYHSLSHQRQIWLLNKNWVQRLELNQLPPGYEPDELPMLYSAINWIPLPYKSSENSQKISALVYVNSYMS